VIGAFQAIFHQFLLINRRSHIILINHIIPIIGEILTPHHSSVKMAGSPSFVCCFQDRDVRMRGGIPLTAAALLAMDN
jgi:hypothetical protein